MVLSDREPAPLQTRDKNCPWINRTSSAISYQWLVEQARLGLQLVFPRQLGTLRHSGPFRQILRRRCVQERVCCKIFQSLFRT